MKDFQRFSLKSRVQKNMYISELTFLAIFWYLLHHSHLISFQFHERKRKKVIHRQNRMFDQTTTRGIKMKAKIQTNPFSCLYNRI